MKLFACMCNQPQRLRDALAPVRGALVAQPPVSRWGLAYGQGGDVLLVRTPKSSDKPVDLAAPLSEIGTDCAIAHAVSADAFSGTDNTPPFRFRRWMFSQTGRVDLDAAAPRLLEHIPEYLRRNLKGRTPGELVFHVFLAMLHDEGSVDDPNLPVAVTRRTLIATIKLVQAEYAQTSTDAAPLRLGNIAAANGRSMIVARLDEPLRLRRLWIPRADRPAERDESFRGVLLVSGGDGDPREGFEDVPAQHAVLVTRDLQVQLADLGA
jgi:glutamine amidotransferase